MGGQWEENLSACAVSEAADCVSGNLAEVDMEAKRAWEAGKGMFASAEL